MELRKNGGYLVGMSFFVMVIVFLFNVLVNKLGFHLTRAGNNFLGFVFIFSVVMFIIGAIWNFVAFLLELKTKTSANKFIKTFLLISVLGILFLIFLSLLMSLML